MATKSKTLDFWRSYFKKENSDIFDIIENAFKVAASDCPKEFRLRRGGIAEMLFSCKLSRCLGCHRVDLAVPCSENEQDEGHKNRFDGNNNECDFEADHGKDMNANISRDEQGVKLNTKQDNNYSFEEAEALCDEIEEESQTVREVLRIKDILENCEDESQAVLLESLRRLQLMTLSVETLKATEIGKSVKTLRRHGSKQISQLARALIDDWMILIDEWVNATEAIAVAEGSPESGKTSITNEEGEEEGLPSPPLDEGAFFATQTNSMELSNFFDGIDDVGNLQKNGEFNNKVKYGRDPSPQKYDVQERKYQSSDMKGTSLKDKKTYVMKKQGVVLKKQTVSKPSKPSSTKPAAGNQTKVNGDVRVYKDTKLQPKMVKVGVQTKPLSSQNKPRRPDEDAAQVKLEASKRKLHERYQQVENAKRQRTIQVMELRDLPKQALGNRNQHMRPGNHNRHFTNGRRQFS